MDNIKIHDVEQGTQEWFDLRKGKVTASNAQKIGSCGKGLDTYIDTKMSEYFSTANKETYTNANMERGVLLEPQARIEYEMLNNVEVEEIGFIEYNEFVGCSPDGFVGEDGGIEIKCHSDVKHYLLLKEGHKKVESVYKWQIQMCLLVTGREWWDYVAYNPNFEVPLFIHRYYPEKDKFDKLYEGFDISERKILEIKEEFKMKGII